MTAPDRHARFQTLIEEHKKILYKVCNAYCRSTDDRDDLAQEIVIALWRSFGKFDDRCRFSTWMYRIALNVAISFFRRENARTRHVLSGDEHLLDVTDEGQSQSNEIVLLYQLIERMEPLNRALILLYLDGYSYEEIADVVGIRETNVATRLSRLKLALKRDLLQMESVWRTRQTGKTLVPNYSRNRRSAGSASTSRPARHDMNAGSRRSRSAVLN